MAVVVTAPNNAGKDFLTGYTTNAPANLFEKFVEAGGATQVARGVLVASSAEVAVGTGGLTAVGGAAGTVFVGQPFLSPTTWNLAQFRNPLKAGFSPQMGTETYLYRVYDSGKASIYGSSWTPLNPQIVGPTIYSQLAGLPLFNLSTHIATAVANPGWQANVIYVGPAERIGSREGGWPEIRFAPGTAEKSVTVISTQPFVGP